MHHGLIRNSDDANISSVLVNMLLDYKVAHAADVLDCRLLATKKPNGGDARPIAVSEVTVRLASLCALVASGQAGSALAPMQRADLRAHACIAASARLLALPRGYHVMAGGAFKAAVRSADTRRACPTKRPAECCCCHDTVHETLQLSSCLADSGLVGWCSCTCPAVVCCCAMLRGQPWILSLRLPGTRRETATRCVVVGLRVPPAS